MRGLQLKAMGGKGRNVLALGVRADFVVCNGERRSLSEGLSLSCFCVVCFFSVAWSDMQLVIHGEGDVANC